MYMGDRLIISTYTIPRSMTRKESYTVDEVLEQVIPYDAKVGDRYIDFNGDLIKMESQRYKLFKRDGCTCVSCGLEGTYFVKEKHRNDLRFHFNLYGLNERNEEILITKDHIIPKSKGGGNNLKNYQVMCYVCNHNKGNDIL